MWSMLRTCMYCLAQTPPLLSLQVRNLRSKVTQDTNLHTLNPWPDPQGTACPGPAGLVTECSRQGDRAYIHSGILTLGPSREDWPPTQWGPPAREPLHALDYQIFPFYRRRWKFTFGREVGELCTMFSRVGSHRNKCT